MGVYLFVLTWMILFKMHFSFQDLRHFTDFRGINLIPFAGSVSKNDQIDTTAIVVIKTEIKHNGSTENTPKVSIKIKSQLLNY